MTFRTFCIVVVIILLVPIYGCETSPRVEAKQSEPNDPRPAISKHVVACTEMLGRAIDANFVQETGVAQCKDQLDKYHKDLLNEVKTDSDGQTGMNAFVNNYVRYEKLFSDIYGAKFLFKKSVDDVQGLKQASDVLKKHTDTLSKLYLNMKGEAAKNLAYVNGRNEALLDRMVLNAELGIVAGTDKDERIQKFDRMARDAAIVGKVIEQMINGDAKQGLVKVTDPKARQELQLAQQAFQPLKTHVISLLDSAPDIHKARLDFEDLQKVAARIEQRQIGVRVKTKYEI